MEENKEKNSESEASEKLHMAIKVMSMLKGLRSLNKNDDSISLLAIVNAEIMEAMTEFFTEHTHATMREVLILTTGAISGVAKTLAASEMIPMHTENLGIERRYELGKSIMSLPGILTADNEIKEHINSMAEKQYDILIRAVEERIAKRKKEKEEPKSEESPNEQS